MTRAKTKALEQANVHNDSLFWYLDTIKFGNGPKVNTRGWLVTYDGDIHYTDLYVVYLFSRG